MINQIITFSPLLLSPGTQRVALPVNAPASAHAMKCYSTSASPGCTHTSSRHHLTALDSLLCCLLVTQCANQSMSGYRPNRSLIITRHTSWRPNQEARSLAKFCLLFNIDLVVSSCSRNRHNDTIRRWIGWDSAKWLSNIREDVFNIFRQNITIELNYNCSKPSAMGNELTIWLMLCSWTRVFPASHVAPPSPLHNQLKVKRSLRETRRPYNLPPPCLLGNETYAKKGLIAF